MPQGMLSPLLFVGRRAINPQSPSKMEGLLHSAILSGSENYSAFGWRLPSLTEMREARVVEELPQLGERGFPRRDISNASRC